MKLILYNNFSETNQLKKTISKIIELEGSLLDSTSIINPVIKIFFNPESMDGYVVDDDKVYVTFNGMKITWDSFIYDYVLAANYAYIPEFNRYYFINDIISVRKNIWQLVMNVDVLMSYKDHILKLDALIERNEFTYSDAIEDNKMPYEFYQSINEYVVTDKRYINFKSYTSGGKNIAISYINNVESNTFNSAVALAPSGVFPTSLLELPSNKPVGSNVYNKYGLTTPNYLKKLLNTLYDDDSQLSFLTSVVVYPFNIPMPAELTESNMQLGSEEYADVKVYGLNSKYDIVSPYYFVASINFNNYFTNSYMDYEPYSKYELYLPFYDYVELKSADIKNSIIDIYYTFDFPNGNGKIHIINRTKNYVIKSVEFNIGVKIAVNRNNLQQLQDERTQLGIKTAITSVGSIASIASGNPVLIASGIMGLTSTFAELGTKLAAQHEKATSSNNSGSNECYGTYDVRLKITRYVKREPYNYSKYFGKPLNDTKKLNELTGYTIVKDLHIENIASATRTEHDQIKSLLEAGIIL